VVPFFGHFKDPTSDTHCFLQKKLIYLLYFTFTLKSSVTVYWKPKKKTLIMQHPNGKNYDHPYNDLNAPLWINPDGSLRDGPMFKINKGSCWSRFRYAPYGEGGMSMYWREIIANMVKEGVGIILMTFLLPGFVATPVAADPVSRAIFVGFIAALSLIGVLNWGYNDRLPRHLTPGATITELLDGSINWLLALIYLGVGFLCATFGALILWGTGSSAIPIIGGPNPTSIGGAFAVQLLFTGAIALSVMDQFTTKKGEPRTFHGRDAAKAKEEDSNASPNNARVFREDIGARPLVYGGFVWLLVSFAFLKYGLFTFNAYIYFAAALSSQLLGAPNAWNNEGLGAVGAYVAGAAALFILTDVLAWVCAWGLNILLYVLHNNEPRAEEDDSSYGQSSMRRSTTKVNKKISQKINSEVRQRSANMEQQQQQPIQPNFNAAAWTGGK
jgi:hypothetical protein